MALIDSCLDSFKPYIQNENPLDCLNYGVEEAAFYRYAQCLREKIEHYDQYSVTAILGTPKPTIPQPPQLDNDKAREYLNRLVPQFCGEDLDWKDKSNKRNMAEVALCSPVCSISTKAAESAGMCSSVYGTYRIFAKSTAR